MGFDPATQVSYIVTRLAFWVPNQDTGFDKCNCADRVAVFVRRVGHGDDPHS